jgi:hypothetical protein
MAEQRTTPEQRAALRERSQLATGLPWEARRQEAVTDTDRWELLGNPPHVRRYLGVLNTLYAPNGDNASLIAEAVNALPALLDDADALAGALATVGRLRAALRNALDDFGIIYGVTGESERAGLAALQAAINRAHAALAPANATSDRTTEGAQ